MRRGWFQLVFMVGDILDSCAGEHLRGWWPGGASVSKVGGPARPRMCSEDRHLYMWTNGTWGGAEETDLHPEGQRSPRTSCMRIRGRACEMCRLAKADLESSNLHLI